MNRTSLKLPLTQHESVLGTWPEGPDASGAAAGRTLVPAHNHVSRHTPPHATPTSWPSPGSIRIHC